MDQSSEVGDAKPSGTPLAKRRLLSEAARLALDCQVACRESRPHCSERSSYGKAEYKRALQLIDACEAACRGLAEACLGRERRQPPPPSFYERCATICLECAEECGRLRDRRLQDLAHAGREAARACNHLVKVERAARNPGS